MRIVTKQEGLPGKGHISIRFSIPEDQHVMVSNWVNYQATPQCVLITFLTKKTSLKQRNHRSNPGRCVSITLGCYLNDGLKESGKAADCTSFEAQTSFSPSIWPHEGLSMRVSFAGKLETLPLSPPLRVRYILVQNHKSILITSQGDT